MSRTWSEKQSRTLMGKLYGYKSMDYKLLLIKAAYVEDFVRLKYILEKDGFIESVDADIPENSTIPSVTEVFPEGAQMQKEITGLYPVKFTSPDTRVNFEQEQNDNLLVEWGLSSTASGTGLFSF